MIIHRNYLIQFYSYACCALLTAAILLTAACSSRELRRTFNEDGSTKEIRYTNEEGKSHTITFSYNTPKQEIEIKKFTPPRMEPVTTISLRYDRRNHVTLVHTSHLVDSNKSTNDVTMKSFFYTRTGRLYKIETSFKSSYSISRNKTTLITAHYRYARGKISLIREYGGTFRKYITTAYSGDTISSISYKYFSMNWRNRKFVPGNRYIFTFDNGIPETVKDMKDNSVIHEQKKVQEIYRETGIQNALGNVFLSSNYKVFLEKLEKDLTNGR